MKSLNELIGLPGRASSVEGNIQDSLLEFVHYFMLVLFLGWFTYFVIVLVKFYHKRRQKVNYTGVKSYATKHLEIGVILVEIILLFGFAIPLWSKRVEAFPDDAIHVRAIGYQYGWVFHYAGLDGKFGRINKNLIKSSKDTGLDMNDPFSRDDFTNTKLTLPNNRPAVIHVTSNDVIHNFAIVKMRVAQDAIPGQVIRTYFTPIEEGSYEIICGQLCGNGHATMAGSLEVKSEEVFDKYLKSNSEQKIKKYNLDQRKKLESDLPLEVIEI